MIPSGRCRLPEKGTLVRQELLCKKLPSINLANNPDDEQIVSPFTGCDEAASSVASRDIASFSLRSCSCFSPSSVHALRKP